MLSNFVRSKSVDTATRNAISAMVEKEANRLGSRTLAYEKVAADIGMSASWVRKYLDGKGEVGEPRTPIFLKIKTAYAALCLRVEHQNRNDEMILQALGKNLNAFDTSFGAQGHSQD